MIFSPDWTGMNPEGRGKSTVLEIVVMLFSSKTPDNIVCR